MIGKQLFQRMSDSVFCRTGHFLAETVAVHHRPDGNWVHMAPGDELQAVGSALRSVKSARFEDGDCQSTMVLNLWRIVC